MTRTQRRSVAIAIAVLLCVTALTAYGVGRQVRWLGWEYLTTGNQFTRHEAQIAGEGAIHWRYRLLTSVLIEGIVRTLRGLGVAEPHPVAFIGFRCAEQVLLFTLAAVWYRRLGLPWPAILLGLAILGWALTNGLFDSGLSFTSYLDVVFYLTAALLLAARRYGWIVPLTVVAAFNRETCGLIPILLAAEGVRFAPRLQVDRRMWTYTGVALVLYAIIIIGLRVWLGMNPIDQPDGHIMGWDLLHYNGTRLATWTQVIGTLGVTPLLGALALRRSPPMLQRMFWVVVPFWFAFHFPGALVVESRLLFVPFVLVLLPLMLFGMMPRAATSDAPPAGAVTA